MFLPPKIATVIGKTLTVLLTLALFYVGFALFMAGEALFAILVIAFATVGAILFMVPKFYALRFVFPGISAVLLFILFPVLYTTGIGFTNYGARNLLTQERVANYMLDLKTTDKSSERPFGLFQSNDGLRIYLPEHNGLPALSTDPIDTGPELVGGAHDGAAPELLSTKDVITHRATLQTLTVEAGDVTLQMSGLRAFAVVTPLYALDGEMLVDRATGLAYLPDQTSGFFVGDDGKSIGPGWRVNVGWTNFKYVFDNENIRAPILQIFVWTVVFATLSMVLTSAFGIVLGTILEWQHLRFRAFYRVMLILPYAVPAFISILVFKGLFNQNFGEINLLLSTVFGLKPAWFTDPFLAKVMLLIVNTWLGYPYMMLLASGYLQSVPRDLYKAAALEGAGPIRSFFSITVPMILPPFVPMMIANFAFNFNNVVIILLLTGGGPDIPGTLVQSGATDLLGSFTFRLAFQNSAQDFGLAGAISSMIFIVTGLLAYVNFKAMQNYAARKGAKNG